MTALLLPGLAFGHGLWVEIAAGPTTTVTTTYGTGEPMAGASFSVLAPGATEPVHAGATDQKGRLSFKPDRIGAWRVQVWGPGGHGATVMVDIDRRALSGPVPVRGEAYYQQPEPPAGTRARVGADA